MTYKVKTIFPKEEIVVNNKLTEKTLNEFIEEVNRDEIIRQYGSLQAKGYSVAVTFIPPEEVEEKELDAFDIAQGFERAAIPYKASLKLKASGTYEEIIKIAKMFDQQGYDYDISIKLQIRENSTVDFEKEKSWFDSDHAKYTILPKASSQDIEDLRTLYENLFEANCKVSINLKAKVKKDDDDVFANQLDSYPDQTLVIFKLSDADIYGE